MRIHIGLRKYFLKNLPRRANLDKKRQEISPCMALNLKCGTGVSSLPKIFEKIGDNEFQCMNPSYFSVFFQSIHCTRLSINGLLISDENESIHFRFCVRLLCCDQSRRAISPFSRFLLRHTIYINQILRVSRGIE